MTKVLIVGMGGVGAVASYTLQTFKDVEVTSVIRSDYETVKEKGYEITPLAVNTKPEQNEKVAFTPKRIVKTLDEAGQYGPYDFIVVSTKVIPQKTGNVWDQVIELKDKLVTKTTGIVLLQNGINLEKHWKPLGVPLISGVSYISSINTKGSVVMYGPDSVSFGLFEGKDDDGVLKTWVDLYSNESFNEVSLDENVRFTRMKKLLYNASYNTVCCLTDSDVGVIYDTEGVLDEVIEPLMLEIQMVANQDLKLKRSQKTITDDDIKNMIKFTDECDASTNYQPSMLVDSRNHRPIELESILGNLIEIYTINSPEADLKKDIPYLNFLYRTLKIILFKLNGGKN